MMIASNNVCWWRLRELDGGNAREKPGLIVSEIIWKVFHLSCEGGNQRGNRLAQVYQENVCRSYLEQSLISVSKRCFHWSKNCSYSYLANDFILIEWCKKYCHHIFVSRCHVDYVSDLWTVNKLRTLCFVCISIWSRSWLVRQSRLIYYGRKWAIEMMIMPL